MQRPHEKTTEKRAAKAPTDARKAARPSLPKSRRQAVTMKDLLRLEILPKLSAQTPYFPIEAIRTELEAARCPVEPATLNSYLHELTQGQFVYNAGRGWYSRLPKPFVLNRDPVSDLVEDLEKTFPLVTFSCWSTEQVKGAMHHLLSRFVTFVNVETDSMEAVWEHLREVGWDASLNPRGTEAARFTVRERTLVVRRESSKSPSNEHFAPIEKLLVELCFEARDLLLISMPEYHSMLANLAGTNRIQIGTLLKYAGDRKLPLGALFGPENQLTPPFEKRRL